ncbi:hypothetical protein PUATCC27989T_05194 [Phytobacter ursingii]|uniref:YfjI family protein n=1 Tax=Enterobacteriaceae TaxID=543 RepID=UPI000CD12D10|nr:MULTISPECIES: YfjI family protein [Citrobacter]AUU99612.1 hypothetical protein C2U51_00615 [Enterobacteriaceae bacterium ENNIH1]VTP17198.1 hypothetical protein PUATCC27989T_05194 [Phytobacter ursingii]HAT2611184.1 DUF3987 domain-containing protein [Kluyvera intermedia]EKY1514300.1 DUF3987 domain-containing protein [Citrobacter freundii]ELA3556244.1 DUF3987 domain-containing protein [Citrobacter freundii]
MLGSNTFPMDAFPPTIRNAIYEVQTQTQAPISLIAASALGVISLVCQNRIDVCRLENLRSSTSLFLLTLAESGERKSTVDKLLLKPLYQLEESHYERYLREVSAYHVEMETVQSKKKALLSKMKSEIRRGKDVSDTEEEIKQLLFSCPSAPTRYKLIFNDATPAAIKNYLNGPWRSVGIMSDEAGTIFNGYGLNELPFINKLWDGSTFSVERKNSPELLIRDARLTLSLMVQPEVFRGYLERKGDMAKGIGFFARCLVCQPISTQGGRQITSPAVSTEHLPEFHKRLMEIVNNSISFNGKTERICLRFSSEAEQRWIVFYNKVESQMGFLGFLSDFKDYASKVAENMARIAALLHYFHYGEGDISLGAVEAAVKISAWYAEEYVQLFSKREEFVLVSSEADELLVWIKSHCFQCVVPYIRKNTILQYGPNRFRNRSKLNELLSTLYSQNKVQTWQRGKTIFIQPVDGFI